MYASDGRERGDGGSSDPPALKGPPSKPESGPECAEAEVLRGEVAELAGSLNVVTARLVGVIRRVIELRVWEGAGFNSVEHWVGLHCGVSSSHAKALVLMARRAEQFPEVMGLFGEGRLSEDQVRPIVRHAPDGYDRSVAEVAEHASVPQLERMMRRYSFRERPPTAKELAGEDHDDDEDAAADDGEQAEPEAERRAEADRDQRQFGSFGHGDDGLWHLRVGLSPEQGEVVARALQVFRQDIFDGDGPDRASWHAALARMAETALAAHGDAKDRRGHDRYQVLLHLNGGQLDRLTGTEPKPRSAYFHLGPAVSQALAKLSSCDASVRLLIDRDGRTVSVGRKYRTVPDHTRRVVEDRDGGACVVPGCSATRSIQVHHLIHWEDGGPTDTDNLACLCPFHHKAVHRGELTIGGDADAPDGGGLSITNRWGRPLQPPPPAPPAGPPPPGHWRHPTGEPYDPACLHLTKHAA